MYIVPKSIVESYSKFVKMVNVLLNNETINCLLLINWTIEFR